MRWVLVMMSGLAFTLGLLCGLLLQLPAGTFPADDHSISITDRDDHMRSRRSLSTGEADVASAGDQARSSLVSGGGGDMVDPSSPSQGQGSFQSPPNPQSASDGFVWGGSEAARDQRRTAGSLHSPGVRQAERRSHTVKSRTKDNNRGGEGDGRGRPQPLPPPPYPPRSPSSSSSSPQAGGGKNKPITSFTLRLKNTGHKFVVDSAVRREQDDEEGGREGEGGRDTQVKEPQAVTDRDRPTNHSGVYNSVEPGFPLKDVVSGALWSTKLEDLCPQGFEPSEVSEWREKAARMQVVKVEEGCGRMQNRLLTLQDGSQACARYRFNTDQIQGDVFSYYLAHLLNLTRHLPPTLLLTVEPLSPQWRGVHLELSMAQWGEGRPVVLTRYLHHLHPALIPPELREDDRHLHPTDTVLGGKSLPQLCDLLQWSDLIVFDYLTANLDRLVNNMFNRQWNPEMMKNPAHNLERTAGGSLVFLDNESGLFHGYRLLDKYRDYHEALLGSLCVFRPSTARAVKALYKGPPTVGQRLQTVLEEGEVHHRHVPGLPEKNAKVLKDRLARVYQQIVTCEDLYSAR